MVVSTLQLDQLIEGDLSEADIETLLDGPLVTKSFGRRLRVVTYMRMRLTMQQDELAAVRPDLPGDAIPLARWHGSNEAARMFDLCDRWRERIMGTAGADTELQAFFDEEQRLQTEWDARRLEASEDLLRQVVRTGSALERLHKGLLVSRPAGLDTSRPGTGVREARRRRRAPLGPGR